MTRARNGDGAKNREYKYNAHLSTIRMVEFHKKQPIWWRVGSNRPDWIPKQRIEQAGEIKDIDGDFAAIVILNESRREECYMVPITAIRARGSFYGRM